MLIRKRELFPWSIGGFSRNVVGFSSNIALISCVKNSNSVGSNSVAPPSVIVSSLFEYLSHWSLTLDEPLYLRLLLNA